MNWKIIYEPYPFDDSKKRAFASAFAFGLFIFLFLLFFQPFGLGNYQSETKTIELAGYGLVTTMCMLTNSFLFYSLFPNWYSKATWTVGKNILYALWMFFTIGLGNLLYSVYQNYLELSFQGFLFYQTLTILVGVFPVVFSTLLVYHKRMENMIKEAKNLNASLSNNEENKGSIIHIPSSNKSEQITIQADHLLMVKSEENYVELYSTQGEKVEKQIIRTTLKSIATAFSATDYIQKCHRSYLVNLNQVAQFSGNAQGLTLHFEHFPDVKVPVSRAYVKKIKSNLSE